MRARGTVGFSLLIALALLWLPSPQAVSAINAAPGAGSPVDKALVYLKGRQQSDGGFAEPGSRSSDQLTTWVVCSIASAGRDPGSWRKSGKSPLDYLSNSARKIQKLSELDKYCLAICSSGKNPRSFGGRDFVKDIRAALSEDGHIGDMVNEHCWSVLALAAAGETLPEASRNWLATQQNLDGGYGYAAGTTSDPDDTGSALQALIASGEPGNSNTVSRAISFLHFCQSPDGGFSYQSGESNVASAAWAVQGLVAAGQDIKSIAWAPSGKSPSDYLMSMQQADGHFRYTNSADTNPAWMTAEVIPALLGKPFPLILASASPAAQSAPEPTLGVPADNTAADSPLDSPVSAGSTNDSAANAQSATGSSTPAQQQSAPSESNARSGTAPLRSKTLAVKSSALQNGSSKRSAALIVIIILCLLAAVGLAVILVRLLYSGRVAD
jgi:Prenyltransferase and squalene oxidase repeat